MSEVRRVLLLVSIMAGIVTAVCAGSILLLYQVSFDQQKERLIDTVKSQARLIEAIAQVQRGGQGQVFSPQARAAIIAQIKNAHNAYEGIGKTGEFTLALRGDEWIVFLLSHRHAYSEQPEPVRFSSALAEPMRQALLGRSGWIVGRDYRGETVLAAHEPVEGLGYGIVAKLDLSEVRAPFIRIGAFAGVGALILVMIGAWAFMRISDPLLHRIRKNDRILRLMSDTIPSVFWVCPPTLDEMTYVSPAYEKIWGRSCASLYAKPDSFLDPVHPDDVERVHGDLHAREDGKWDLRYRIIRPDGTIRWISDRGFPIYDDTGHVYLMAGLAQDITQQVKAEEELRAAKDEAEFASRTKSLFLANMSHELRTPLNAILGFSDAIETEVFGKLRNPKYMEYVNNIHQSGEHLLQLINDILDLSKVEAGAMELDEDTIDMSSVCENVACLVRPRAEKGRVKLDCDIVKPTPVLFGDELRVKQVLFNLLSNAIKFTDPGGEVRLVIKLGEDGALLLQVHDNGIGMDADELEVAFSSFGQVDGSLVRRHEGTGLGLPLTRALVELHDGEISVDTCIGDGTQVQVRFPPERVVLTSEMADNGVLSA